jgi:F-type H+-transporting ATPase subunit delta
MATNDKVAAVYANALLELTQKQGGNTRAQEVGEEFRQLAEMINEDKSFRSLLASPTIERGARSAALDRILRGNVSDVLMRFIMVVDRKGRLNHLVEMEEAYDELLQGLFGKTEVDVFTVDGQPLEKATETSLCERLRTATGREAVFHYAADASMIGGIKLRIEDQLVDGSVATRLRRLRESIIRGGGATIRGNTERFIG